MRIDIVTIFPAYFAPLELSLLGRARQLALVQITVHDLRRWASGPHRSVDDAPFGGGPGMVMRPEPWGAALDALIGAGPPAHEAPPRLIVPTPSGRRFTQAQARELANERWLIFACGRYEGIDARVVEDASTRVPVSEISVGDYVLAGGEAATLVLLEAITRLLPGVVGNPASVTEDSFADLGPQGEELVEGPVYTRPAVWRGRAVPDVLRSGDHQAIARWRREQAALRTAERSRPDAGLAGGPGGVPGGDLRADNTPPTSPGMAQ